MKKAIIIGATSGLGKELAKLLAKNDYLVGITGRRTELLNNIEAENPKLYRIKSFDITEIDIIETKLNEEICYTEVRGKLLEAKIGKPRFVKEGEKIF